MVRTTSLNKNISGIVVLLIIFILIFSTTTSAQIEVEPNSMNVDLIGGQTVTKQITIPSQTP